MEDTGLPMSDFRAYGMMSMLGALSLPNGGFNVSLSKLYNSIQWEWKINSKPMDMHKVIAVIAFGSAVRYPGYTEKNVQSKKYFLFGSPVERRTKIPIKPNDVDFLVVTKENMTEEKYIDSRSSYDYGNDHCRKEGNMHLVPRGVDQIIVGVNGSYRSIQYGIADTVSESALRYGVPLFYEKEELEELIRRSGIKKETPRKVFWKKDWNDKLAGRIR